MDLKHPLDVWVTRHARERLQQHYPTCGIRGAKSLLAMAEEIAAGEAHGFLCRRAPDKSSPDRYFIAHDRRGIFVLAPMRPVEGKPDLLGLVTYIRLLDSQIEQAKVLWGPGQPTFRPPGVPVGLVRRAS